LLVTSIRVLQKRMNRSRCGLMCGLTRAQGTTCFVRGPGSPPREGAVCAWGCIWACPDLPAVDVLNTGHRCCRQAASQISHTAIGVNAAWVAGVATPQYLTCMGRPVLTSPHPRRLYTAPRFSSLRRSTCDPPPDVPVALTTMHTTTDGGATTSAIHC